jgi:hypothetical protein
VSVKNGSRVAAAVGAVVLAGVLCACTSGGSAADSAAGAAVATDLAKAKAALAQSRTQLKTLVDSLARSANPASRAPFPECRTETAAGRPPDACSGFDAEAACVAAARDWPQRWGYNVNIHLAGGDALAAGRSVVTQLVGSKWTLRQQQPNGQVVQLRPGENLRSTAVGVLKVTGEKNGVSLRITVDDLPGVVNLEGYGPCLSAAGTPVAPQA